MIEFAVLDPESPQLTDAVKLLIREVDLKRAKDRTVTSQLIADRLAIAEHHSYLYCGLFDERAAVLAAACISHSPGDAANTTDMVIWSMAVQPEKQRGGLGRLLVQHIAQLAIEHGDALISLDPQEDAKPFYTKLGFTFVEETTMVVDPRTMLEG